MNIETILDEMTVEELIALCSGEDFWHTKTYKEHDIPSIMLSDGPHGLRKQEENSDMLGINQSVPATSFPTAASTGCSWDPSLLERIGKAIANEALFHNVSVLLGPGANIKRNPLCGRNFEYFSEDPLLSGKLAAAFITGVESTGVSSSLKHFACNNQEYKRFSSDSILDERTLREIYLKGFEIAVKEGKPSTVMSAYNKINGVYCSSNQELLKDILRDDFGFDGLVVTDWGGMHDRIEGFKAGCDLVMPGGSAYMEKESLEAIQDGTLDIAAVKQSARRVLKLIKKSQKLLDHKINLDMDLHHELAKEAAIDSAVLMKNNGNLLPLQEDQSIVFIGHMAKHIRYQGAGSSHINPWKIVNATEACPDIPFIEGYDEFGKTTDDMLEDAVLAAKEVDCAVVFIGLPPAFESEGFDRDHLKLPDGMLRLVEEVVRANTKVAVVIMSGSVVELPFTDKVKSILYMGLPGQAGGVAIANLLFGRAVPSGKLAESWPIEYEDCVCSSYYGGTLKDAHYREGIYVGYRYYDTSNTKVRYPFGHGLSYSSFEYSNLVSKPNQVSIDVKNTGLYKAKEVVQLYVLAPQGNIARPYKELKAFQKIELEINETKTIHFDIEDHFFSIWQDTWVTPAANYTIAVGGDVNNLLETAYVVDSTDSISLSSSHSWYTAPSLYPSHAEWENHLGRQVESKPLVKGQFTMSNTVMEMKDYSWIMKIMFKAVESTIAKGFNGKKDYSNPEFRMLMNSAADASLFAMKVSGGLRNYVLEGMLAMANGQYLKGLKYMLKKY